MAGSVGGRSNGFGHDSLWFVPEFYVFWWPSYTFSELRTFLWHQGPYGLPPFLKAPVPYGLMMLLHSSFPPSGLLSLISLCSLILNESFLKPSGISSWKLLKPKLQTAAFPPACPRTGSSPKSDHIHRQENCISELHPTWSIHPLWRWEFKTLCDYLHLNVFCHPSLHQPQHKHSNSDKEADQLSSKL